MSLPSLVLNFVLRTSSPESFPFFPAKVALGQPDKLEAKVTHHNESQVLVGSWMELSSSFPFAL